MAAYSLVSPRWRWFRFHISPRIEMEGSQTFTILSNDGFSWAALGFWGICLVGMGLEYWCGHWRYMSGLGHHLTQFQRTFTGIHQDW